MGEGIGKEHGGVAGIVGQQRENIELGVIRAAVINQFDASADAVDVGLDRFERVGSANRWNIPSNTHGDLELQAQSSEVRSLRGYAGLMHTTGKDDAGDRMINAAECLHRR